MVSGIEDTVTPAVAVAGFSPTFMEESPLPYTADVCGSAVASAPPTMTSELLLALRAEESRVFMK